MKKEIKTTPMGIPTPTYVVATYNQDGSVDAMNLAWGGVCGANPPCVQISVNTGRRTRENILRTGAFSLNVGGVELMKVTDYFGLVSGAEADKLSATGITASKGKHVNAPTLDQYPLSMECEMIDAREIGPHLMIIAEIKGIMVEASVMDEDGRVSVEKMAPICLDPIGLNYYVLDKIAGKAYDEGKVLLSNK